MSWISLPRDCWAKTLGASRNPEGGGIILVLIGADGAGIAQIQIDDDQVATLHEVIDHAVACPAELFVAGHA